MPFDLNSFTLVHIVLSLVGIATGFIVLGGFFARAEPRLASHLFLWTTIATNVTGFLFPFTQLLPSHVLAILSLLVLAVAAWAYYARHLAGRTRLVYIVAATAALYLNVFVLAVQTFVKNPALKALAPTQSEPPFALVQGLILLAFAAAGYCAVKRVRSA